MKNKMVEKDERTTFIETVSYKLGYKFIAFALLVDASYRQRKFNEEPWDLFIIIIISGLVMAIYQYKQKILGIAWIKNIVLTLVIACVCIFLLVFC
ncbi:hypothetical protein HGG79_00750 [Clostridium tetanomorphum]|uniref:Uncharacterized protein n=2 Tax=Clostridium tetanomorphum TaxID=1553 RepID=A0A923E9E4_CLOTT|nr:hypothetical protein [Clostridium tetanomorphum]